MACLRRGCRYPAMENRPLPGRLLADCVNAADGAWTCRLRRRPVGTDLGIERLNDAHIATKSSWSSGQVVAETSVGLSLRRFAVIGFVVRLKRAEPALGNDRD